MAASHSLVTRKKVKQCNLPNRSNAKGQTNSLCCVLLVCVLCVVLDVVFCVVLELLSCVVLELVLCIVLELVLCVVLDVVLCVVLQPRARFASSRGFITYVRRDSQTV